MVGIFMAPFVTKPKSMSSEHNEKRNNNNSDNNQKSSKSSSNTQQISILTRLFDKYASKLYESNRICAFLATLSALFLSLILYFHQYML